MTIKEVPLNALHPYEKNARRNENALEPVANSIREFGFRSPIIATVDGEIICGHTRYAAAQRLGLKTVPVLYASDLSPAQVKAYRLADNKVSELAKWDNALLIEELEELKTLDELEVDMSDFGFDDSEMFARRAGWSRTEKYCDLKKKIRQHTNGDMSWQTMYEVGERGILLTDLKEKPENAELIAANLVDVVLMTLGGNVEQNGWAMLTAPRRRHKKGFHFSTAIYEEAARQLQIPFYVDAFHAKTRDRIEPKFELTVSPKERNIIFFDDISTTGRTMRTCRELLVARGYSVMLVIGVFNHT